VEEMMLKTGNKLNYCLIALAVLLLTGSAGCILLEPLENQSNIQPVETHFEKQPGLSNGIPTEMYSSPLGAFRNSWAVLSPNMSYETDYVFYSNAWGPGEVNYTLSGPVISDPAYKNWSVNIQPSMFTAKPDTQYISRVTVNAGSQPSEDYGLPLFINVTLSDNTTHFCNDTLSLYPGIPPGLISGQDSLLFKTPVVIKKGEMRNYSIFYERGIWAGFGDIIYSVSPSSLNSTISPSTIHVKQGLRFPAELSIYASPSISAGNYTINLIVKGSSDELYLRDENGMFYSAPLDQPQKIIPIEVDVE
jgi:hypothetical protein